MTYLLTDIFSLSQKMLIKKIVGRKIFDDSVNGYVSVLKPRGLLVSSKRLGKTVLARLTRLS